MTDLVPPPLLRGTFEGADCNVCPLARNGRPYQAVRSEFPEKPAWVVIGEGPSMTEARHDRPWIGPSGEVLNKALAMVRRPRVELAILNATSCLPPFGSTEKVKSAAAAACRPRVARELAQWPGIPVLTLGAVAARALIPKERLDAIDPPESGKKKRPKPKDLTTEKRKREAKLAKIEARMLVDKMKYRERQITKELRDSGHKKIAKGYAKRQALLDQPAIARKAAADAIVELEQREQLKLDKPKTRAKRPIRISDIASTLFEVDLDGTGPRLLIPALHPAALLRGGGATLAGTHTPDLAFINIVADAAKADALARGRDVRLKLDIEIEVEDEERANALAMSLLDEAYMDKELGIDLETYVEDPMKHTALQCYWAHVSELGLSTKKRAISVLWDLLWPATKQAFAMLLADEAVTTVYHNGMYDKTVLEARGYPARGPWHCTMLMHHAAFPGMAHNLQSVTTQFYGMAPWKSEHRNSDETPESRAVYNAKDVGSTHAIVSPLQLWIKKTQTEKTYEHDKKMSEIASRMHLDGIPLNRQVNDELLNRFTIGVKEARRSVEALAEDPETKHGIFHWMAFEQAKKKRKTDPDDFEERYERRMEELDVLDAKGKWRWKISGGQHIAALMRARGIELSQVTDAGLVSTKKEILEGMAHLPIVRDILSFRENDKLLSSFIWTMFDRYNGAGELLNYGFADEHGRIHPTWRVHLISGRWASDNPMVSNVPKNKLKKQADGTVKEIRPNLRRQVVAPPGRVFVGFDSKQLEARCIGLLSGDPWLCTILKDTSQDLHNNCAEVVFGERFTNGEKLYKKQLREIVKPLEYLTFYLGGAETGWKNLLKEGFDLKLTDVQLAMAKLMRRMPGVVNWQQNMLTLAAQPPHELRSPVTQRRRNFPLGQVDPNEVVNWVNQCLGADIVNTGLINMYQRLPKYKDAFFLLHMHDSVPIECWEDDAPAIMQDVKECFELEFTHNGMTMPFPVDAKVAKSWAEL